MAGYATISEKQGGTAMNESFREKMVSANRKISEIEAMGYEVIQGVVFRRNTEHKNEFVRVCHVEDFEA